MLGHPKRLEPGFLGLARDRRDTRRRDLKYGYAKFHSGVPPRRLFYPEIAIKSRKFH
jgi:hypothetical protein